MWSSLTRKQLAVCLVVGSSPLSGWAESQTATVTQTQAEAPAVPTQAVPMAPPPSSTDAPGTAPTSIPIASEITAPPQSAADARRAREEAVRIKRRAGEADISVRQRRVSAIEEDFSGFDPRLVDALIELGKSMHAIGHNNDALGVLERAQHVSRVTDGLYSLEQLKSIDVIAAVLSDLNRWADAIKAKEYALYLVQHQYPGDSMEMVEQLNDLASWYESVGHVFGARQAYERAAVIIDARVNPDDPKRAEALRRLARSYRLERFPVHRIRDDEQRFEVDPGAPDLLGSERRVGMLNRFAPGENALKESIRIYQRQQPVATAATAATLVELGDWYLLFNKFDLAMASYREARAQLALQPDQQVALFAAPAPVYFRPPAAPPRPAVDAIPEYRGFVELTFDVSERGDVANVQVISAVPEQLLTDQLLEAMRRARFRPTLDASGNAVASSGAHFRFEFPYFEQAGS